MPTLSAVRFPHFYRYGLQFRTWRDEEDDVLTFGHEGPGREVGDDVADRASDVIEAEVFDGREVRHRGPHPGPVRVLRARWEDHFALARILGIW